mmetsp:Transcript_18237/g.27698  ORF Transcript_18237/g.27698 Transcript_18237/m.27698 type:complete len:96 (+) Transcript_18237:546-833(+)
MSKRFLFSTDMSISKDASTLSEVRPEMMLCHANWSEHTLYSGNLGKNIIDDVARKSEMTTVKKYQALQERSRQFQCDPPAASVLIMRDGNLDGSG